MAKFSWRLIQGVIQAAETDRGVGKRFHAAADPASSGRSTAIPSEENDLWKASYLFVATLRLIATKSPRDELHI